MKFILVPLLSLILCVSVHAQKSMLNDTKTYDIILKGITHTYNFQFDEAKKYFEEVKRLYPDHPAYPFLMSANLYYEMLYNDSYKEKSEDYFNYLKTTLTRANTLLEKNSQDMEGIFFHMASESSMALYYAERNENRKCISHAKEAYNSMKEGFKLKSKFSDFYLSTGLYNYFVVQYPETHPVFKPFMFFFAKGDKKKGIEELEYGAKNGIFSKVECLHYLANIFIKYENNPTQAFAYTSQLVEDYPQNYYFIARHIEVLIALKKYKEAEIYSYKLYQTGKNSFIMRSFTFYGQLNEKYFLKPDLAIKYYNQAINRASELHQPTGDYLAYAYTGLGRIYFAKGEKEKAVEYYKKAEEYAECKGVKEEIEDFLDKND